MPKRKGRKPSPEKNRVVLNARVAPETMRKIDARAPSVGGQGRAVDEAFGVIGAATIGHWAANSHK